MKDAAETRTADLLPTPKKRGRPATGTAMTAAERKRAQREHLPGYSMDISMTECSDTALFTAMQRARRDSNIVIGEMLAAEYVRRLQQEPRQSPAAGLPA